MPRRKKGGSAAAKRSVPKIVIMPVAHQGMGGDGFFQDVWSGLKSAHDFIKGNKLVSRGAELASRIGIPHADKVRDLAKVAGYGKKRRKGGMKGRGDGVLKM